jgi:methionyl-tRNA synthetase
MSDFQQKLLDLYSRSPASSSQACATRSFSFVRAGARRPVHLPFELRWGIPNPWDHSHVVYVLVRARCSTTSPRSASSGTDTENFEQRYGQLPFRTGWGRGNMR